MANNHMGQVNHGIKLIKAFGKICKKYPFNFAFKFKLVFNIDIALEKFEDILSIMPITPLEDITPRSSFTP